MVTKSKLKLALAAETGVDFRKVKEKRKVKAALKEKAKKNASKSRPSVEDDEDDWEDEEEDEDEEELGNGLLDMEAEESGSDEDDDEEDEDGIDLGALEDSESSDSEVEMEEKIARPKAVPQPSKPSKTKESRTKTPSNKPATKGVDESEEDEDGDEEEDEEDIPMSDLEDLPDEEKDDLIRHQRLTINNTTALLASLKRIAIATDSSVPFASHMCIVSSESTADGIPDVSDDLNRELALYKQSLEAAKKARSLLRAEKVPFSRPGDYFAEMVKADDHMEKVKAKLVEDATAKKAAAEARKLRDLKKFGKQVQVAKMQERAKAKKDTLEKIKSLKRKRQESSAELPAREADLFDVAVDNELKTHKGGSGGKGPRGAGGAGGEAGRKRQKKNDKFGFGGRKRNSKSGDAMSSGDLSGFNLNRMRGKSGGGGKAPRPGKSKRKASAGRR